MDIDIIIPVLNEEKFLTEHHEYYKNLSKNSNIIFVDGGSKDRTAQLAQDYGDVIVSRRGRSLQKNAGAHVAKASLLLFLHVDAMINPDVLPVIENTLLNGAQSGCMTMRINDRAFIFRAFESIVNLRARMLKIIDGDCGQFIRRDTFLQAGFYDDVPDMEDILFSKKMRQAGHVTVLSDQIHVSARKWKEVGFSKLLCQYLQSYIHLWAGRFLAK